MKYLNKNSGNALLITLLIMTAVATFVGVAMNATTANAKFTDRSNDYMALQSAVEGALEHAYAYWRSNMGINGDRPVSTTSANTSLSNPTFTGANTFTWVDNLKIEACDQYNVALSNAASKPTAVRVELEDYAGWRGYVSSYTAKAKMKTSTASGDITIGLKRTFQFQSVPLFQAMMFFETDIELYQMPEMYINGLVHSNSKLYVSGNKNSGTNLTFGDNVSYSNNNDYSTQGYFETAPPYAYLWSSYTANSNKAPVYPDGKSEQLSQVDRMEPLGATAKNTLSTADTNLNNDSFRELIEPPVTGTGQSDPAAMSDRRLYNKAGIILKISGVLSSSSTSTITPTITATTQNGVSVGSANFSQAIVNKKNIYDKREAGNVAVTTIDMAKLKTELEKTTNFNGVLYIHDTTTGSTNPKEAVRLTNGKILPTNGLTLVSEDGVYIQGDYNTGGTGTTTAASSSSNGNPSNADSPVVAGYDRPPTAVIADAVMILSNSWNDTNANKTVSNRAASHTTVNTAIVSGFIPSYYPKSGGGNYKYSGGGNNFPRFLETWSGDHFTYYGSMVQLFVSEKFIGQWDTGDIYVPPSRMWNFDTEFVNDPPPGSLDATINGKGAWAYY